ncbi:MAG: sterol desaturase family protein [Acidobacteria bacterium]|nr:sterol desaturase family protein [Acidobacteriota bacterium]
MKWLRGALVIGTFAALYLLENKRPLRRQKESKAVETVRNLALAATAGLAVALLENPVAGRLTAAVERNDIGLLKIRRLPKPLETALAVVLLDYTLYWWHVLTHRLPFLWNFHRVHHADRDLTVSTAIRFHFGEIALSVLFRAGQILLIGVSPPALTIWQTLLLLSIFFHHSNVRLPKNLESKLEFLMMTPRLHGIHHSAAMDEMDSNWSSGLTVWDRLHGTFRDDVPQAAIEIGVGEFPDERQVTFRRMLAAPFSG